MNLCKHLSVELIVKERTKEERKAGWERDVFIQFATAARIDTDLESVKGHRFPKPDISCRIGEQLYYFELVEIVDERLARRHSASIKTMQPAPSFFTFKQPLLKAFRAKASKLYAVDGPLDLVAYFEKQYPPTFDLELIPKTVGSIANEMINSGHWCRIWVYDRWKKRILWRFPN